MMIILSLLIGLKMTQIQEYYQNSPSPSQRSFIEPIGQIQQNYIDNYPLLMLSDDQFQTIDHNELTVDKSNIKNIWTQDVSVLKYLPQARQILSHHHFEIQPINNYLFPTKFVHVPIETFGTRQQEPFEQKKVMKKKLQINKPSMGNRLDKIEETINEYNNIKQKFNGEITRAIHNQNKFLGTLWAIYGHRAPSYARFGNTASKNNFANVLVRLCGIPLLLTNPNQIKKEKAIQMEQNQPIIEADSIKFESNFQSGNLLFAYRNTSTEIQTYDLILQNDTNTKGHNQWFYFRVKNTKKHNRIKFNIVNFIKNQSLFSYGIKPLVFSEKAYHRNGTGWLRQGDKINYYPNRIMRETTNKTLYTASFEYYFQEEDSVYFAPVFPYTCAQLIKYLNQIIPKQINPNPTFSIKTISETIAGNKLPIITISINESPEYNKSIVWIIGRQHPAETTGSYMMEGVIDYVMNLYKNPSNDIKQLVNKTTFKIIPMMNPDGVIHGNTRCEITGVDPNRMWKKPVKRLCPEIVAIKKAISQNKTNVSLVLDLHSHSKKLGCFFYGNSLLHNPQAAKIYPSLICSLDERFSLKNCRFRGGYDTTARRVALNELDIPYFYTVQCSLIGYLKNNRIVQYTQNDYRRMGETLIKGHFDLQYKKAMKKQHEILKQIQICENQEVDSARSESSLSEEEYEEIKQKKLPKKKNIKIRKCIATQNSVQILRDIPKKHGRMNTEYEKINNRFQRLLYSHGSATGVPKQKRDKDRFKLSNEALSSTIKKGVGLQQISNYNKEILQYNNKVSQNALKIPKIHTRNQLKERIRHQERGNTNQLQTGDYGAQINLPTLPMKSDHNQQYLCVIGNGLDQDLVLNIRNDVGLQVRGQNIDEGIKHQKSGNLKKLPRVMGYLCSNLIGVSKQKSLFNPERKAKMRRL